MKMLKALFLSLVLAATAEAADIVVLGEVHDNADAHLGQAERLRVLQPSAVVFEMLTAEQGLRADTNRDGIAEIWAEGDWPDFGLYAPVFEALVNARIVGAAQPRSAVRGVFSTGAAVAFGNDAVRFGLDRPLPAEQQAAREALQFEAHCDALPMEMMDGMVEVQRYRDARFAQAALAALDAYGPPVAVVAGNGHARTDWGIPAMIAHAAPQVRVIAIGFVEEVTDVPFDEVLIVPPADREDPCKAFE